MAIKFFHGEPARNLVINAEMKEWKQQKHDRHKATEYKKIVISESEKVYLYMGNNMAIPDPQLGETTPSNAEIHHYLIKNDETLYDIKYKTDKFGRRITPSNSSSAKKAILFFGCSNIFGNGVMSNQTIPSNTAQILDNYNSYNYGLSGSGTGYMLAQIEARDFTSEVTEENKIFVYFYIDHHVHRNIASTSAPYFEQPYYFSVADKLYRKGNFRTGRPLVNKLYELWMDSALYQNLRINLPFYITKSHERLTCLMANQAQSIINKRYPGSKYIFVSHPTSDLEAPENTNLKECLIEKGITYISFPTTMLGKYSDEELYIPYDGYYTPFANKITAEEFIHKLREKVEL